LIIANRAPDTNGVNPSISAAPHIHLSRGGDRVGEGNFKAFSSFAVPCRALPTPTGAAWRLRHCRN
jgi:hypothetical protein